MHLATQFHQLLMQLLIAALMNGVRLNYHDDLVVMCMVEMRCDAKIIF